MSDNLTFKELNIDGYEQVIEVKDAASELHAIIALHDTTLGPAVGGSRAYPYESFDQALEDVLRLSKGMTYKSAVSESGTSGGKSVIITKKGQTKSKELLRAFGQAVNRLNGKYICAEDIGMSPSDLRVVREETRYVVGLLHSSSSGDPSPFTAWGGFRGIHAVCHKLWGSESVQGKTIAIQGLGSVGMKLAAHLFWGGARLIVTDVNEAAVEEAVRLYSAKAVGLDEIYEAECDIFAPCALGGILNENTIPKLRCKAVAGLANNQLLTEADGQRLTDRNILYSPDFVTNSGGLFNVCEEITKDGYDPFYARHQVNRIFNLLLTIFTLAEEKQQTTQQVALEIAEYNIANQIGKRTESVVFHH